MDPYLQAYQCLEKGEPRRAIRQGRSVAAKDPVRWRSELNLSGLLIDAGSDLGSARLVREGVGRLSDVLSLIPSTSQATAHYNLGNGFLSLGQRERGKSPGTRPSLSFAISHLAGSLAQEPRPNARVNLAYALTEQGRYVEALDELNEVITQDPTHHSAYAGRARALWFSFMHLSGHPGLLQSAYLDYERAIETSSGSPVFQRSYQRSLARLQKQVRTPVFRATSASARELGMAAGTCTQPVSLLPRTDTQCIRRLSPQGAPGSS